MLLEKFCRSFHNSNLLRDRDPPVPQHVVLRGKALGGLLDLSLTNFADSRRFPLTEIVTGASIKTPPLTPHGRLQKPACRRA